MLWSKILRSIYDSGTLLSGAPAPKIDGDDDTHTVPTYIIARVQPATELFPNQLLIDVLLTYIQQLLLLSKTEEVEQQTYSMRPTAGPSFLL